MDESGVIRAVWTPHPKLGYGVAAVLIATYVACAVGAWMMRNGALPFGLALLDQSEVPQMDFGAGGVMTFRAGYMWTLISSAFLHANIDHLFGNLLFILILLPPVARCHGSGSAFALFVFCCVTASVGALISGAPFFFGASGGCYGLLAARLVSGWRMGGTYGRRLVWRSLFWSLTTVLLSFTVSMPVSHAAHLGGYLGGIMFTLWLCRNHAASPEVGPEALPGWRGVLFSAKVVERSFHEALLETHSAVTRRWLAIGSIMLTVMAVAAAAWRGFGFVQLAMENPQAYRIHFVTSNRDNLDYMIKQDPGNDALYVLRARIHDLLRDDDLILPDLDAAVRINPSAKNLTERGSFLASQGNLEQALADYERIVQLHPENRASYISRARVFRRFGKFDLAEADCGRALEHDDKSVQAAALRLRASLRERREALGEALADYERLVALTNDSDDLAVQARLYQRVGENKRAFEIYNLLIKREPANAEFYTDRAGVHVSDDRPELALEDMNTAVRLETNEMRKAGHLGLRGIVYEMLNERDKAAADYRAALAINPDDSSTADSLKKIEAAN